MLVVDLEIIILNMLSGRCVVRLSIERFFSHPKEYLTLTLFLSSQTCLTWGFPVFLDIAMLP